MTQSSESRSSHRRCTLKKENKAYSFVKTETLAQVLSSEFCEISKNTFFTEHLLATGSEIYENY